MRKITFIALLLFVGLELSGQQDLGTSFLRDTWQINYTNPARTPEGMRFAISLPGLYANVSSPLAYNQLITATATGNLLDIDNAIGTLNNNSRLFLNAHAHSFNIAFKVKNMTFNLGHVVRSDLGIRFPKELAALAWNGNAAYIGENLEISPHVLFNLYNEYNIGGSYETGNLTVGAKIKLLAGIGTISSKNPSVSLTTDSDVYQLDFNGDYSIRTAGLFTIDAQDGITLEEDLINSNRLFSGNLGIGIDLGLSYRMTDKLTLSASLLDLGGIRWKDIPKVYSASGNARFEGINLISYTQDFSLSFEEKKDSILNLFNVSEEEKTFTSPLPKRAYFNADYELNKWITLGGLVYFEDYQRNLNAGFSAGATLHLGKILDLGANYSIRSNSAANIGLSTVLNLGPIQFFAMTDNMLAVFSPESQRNANFRTGLNLIFRDREAKEKEAKGKVNKAYRNAPPVECANPKKRKR